jgi:crotonobetainyl-CoA:carnitine CoA-transferase CaiB-like acyl-CoA transferase
MQALVPGPHQPALRQELGAVFLSKTRSDWAEFAEKHDCCLEPVLEPEELEEDEQLGERGVFFEMESPWGTIGQLRIPVGARGGPHVAPPKKGEHTEEILRDAGFAEKEIAELRTAGAMG